jgi:MYXO-CTERM domain-containing protein
VRKLAQDALWVLGVLTVLVIGAPGVLRAGPVTSAPEVDPSTGVAALALLAGAVLVIRGRRKK